MYQLCHDLLKGYIDYAMMWLLWYSLLGEKTHLIIACIIKCTVVQPCLAHLGLPNPTTSHENKQTPSSGHLTLPPALYPTSSPSILPLPPFNPIFSPFITQHMGHCLRLFCQLYHSCIRPVLFYGGHT